MPLAESSFAGRLGTNYVPSDPEIVEIRALLADPADELARVEARIKEMEIALGQLRALRASLKTPIDAHKALVSPMRHIPQGVLLAIFSSCLPSEHNAVIDPTEAPLLLGRACRHWRDATYSTPMLWSSIHIPVLDLRAPLPLRRRLEGIVQAWLERSATCPLSVSFFDDNHYDESAPSPENHPIILQLLPISRRLRHLTLAGDTELLRPFLRLGTESLPLLKRVWIQPPSGSNFLSEDDEDHPPSTNALQLATLEDVTLQMSSATDPLTLPLRWSQLTQLRLESFPVWLHQGQEGGLDVDGVLDVLRRCPNLVQCEIRVTTPSEYPPTTFDTSSIILPHMHTLVLSDYRLRFRKWIAHLVVPKLCFLRVGDEMDWEHTASSAARDGYMSADIDTTRFTSSGLPRTFAVLPNDLPPPTGLKHGNTCPTR